MDSIISIVDSLVQEYTVELVNEFEIDIEKCEAIWQRISKKNKLSKSEKTEEKKSPEKKQKSEEKEKKSPEKKQKSEEKEKKEGGGICLYEYTRKPREGEKCGAKVKDGSDYCSKHKEADGKDKKDKAVIPKVASKEDKVEKKKEKVDEKKKESPKKEMVVAKPIFKVNNDIKKHVHADTGMVLKSATEKKIIGKLENKKIIDLTEADLETCKKWKFVIDDSQLAKLKKDEKKGVCVDKEEDLVEPEYTHPVVDKFFIRGKWGDDLDNKIKGRMTRDHLASFVKKSIAEGEYDEEFSEDGYPVKLTLDKKAKKIVCEYTDGEGNFCNVNISTGGDDDLKVLYKYLEDMKDEDEEEEIDVDALNKNKKEKTEKIMKALIKDEKSEKKEKDVKGKDDNLSKKSAKKSVDEDEDEDIADILDEVEEEDEENNEEVEEEDEQIAYVDDLIKPLEEEDEDYFHEYLEEVKEEDRDDEWYVTLFKKKGSNGKTVLEVAKEKGYKKICKMIKEKYLS